MSFYQFKEEDAYEFARQQGIKATRSGDELQFQYCPYCHGGPHKDKKTFAINLKSGAFNCRRSSCGQNGNMVNLSRHFGFSLGRDVDAYYHTVAYADKQFRRFRENHAIKSFDAALVYLEGRGIPGTVTEEYEITCRKDDPRILVFPFRDENGELQMFKYRNTEFKKGDNGSKEWCEKNCKPILFGMAQCAGSGTLVITEGQIDSLSVRAAGFENAVSVPFGKNGFTWIPYCFDFLQRFQQIVVFGDNENGHITLSDEISSRFPKKTKVVRVEDYQECKDANDLLQLHGIDAIKKAVNNAAPISDNRIKRIADVVTKDIEEIDGVITGFDSLDEILGGKLRLGQLVILTGRRGDGKSTLGSMIAVNAIHQGFRTFFYSGELTDYIFRNWIDRQVSGKELTLATKDPETSLLLDQFYGDKAYLFDNSFLTDTDEDEQTALLNALEIAIVQYGCRFLVVDNLMSALTAGPQADIYRAQSDFVGKLVKLTKRYNIIILLIAHPRKQNGNLSNDDISGSADITNKADIVLSYGRKEKKKGDEDLPDDMRVLYVLKNRLNGKLTRDEGIKLVFHEKSKRIAEKTSNFFRTTYLPQTLTDEEIEDLPFNH